MEDTNVVVQEEFQSLPGFFSSSDLLDDLAGEMDRLSFNPYRASFPLRTSLSLFQSQRSSELFQSLPGFFSSSDQIQAMTQASYGKVSIPTGLLFLFGHHLCQYQDLFAYRFNPYRASFPLRTVSRQIQIPGTSQFQSLPGFFSSSDLSSFGTRY